MDDVADFVMNVFTKRTNDELPVIKALVAYLDMSPYAAITVAGMFDYFGSWESLWQAAEIGYYYSRYAVRERMSVSLLKFIDELKRAYYATGC